MLEIGGMETLYIVELLKFHKYARSNFVRFDSSKNQL